MQTSLDLINIHQDMKHKPTRSPDEHPTSLDSHTAELDHQYYVHPSVDTNYPRMKSEISRPESGRDESVLRSIAKDHSCTGCRRRAPPPHTIPRARSASPRIDPRVKYNEDGTGAGSELPLPSRLLPLVPCSGDPGVALQNGDRGEKLSSFQAQVSSHSVGRDREPFVSSRSGVPADSDDGNILPSQSGDRYRGPSFNRRTRVPSDSDNVNKVPSSRSRVPSDSDNVNKVPSSRSRVPSDSDNVNKVPSSWSRVPSDNDNVNKVPSSRSRVSSDSDNVNKVPSSRTRVPSDNDNVNKVPSSRSRVPSDSDNVNKVPSSRTRVPSDNDNVNKVPSSQTREPSQSVYSDSDSRSGVPADGDDIIAHPHSECCSHRRQSRSHRRHIDRSCSVAEDRQQLSLTGSVDNDVTVTSAWSDGSPCQRSTCRLAQVGTLMCTIFSVIFVLIYFLVLVLVLVFRLIFSFSFVLVFIIYSF